MIRDSISYTFLFLALSLSSCNEKSKHQFTTEKEFTLLDTQIIDLLKLIASNEYDSLNFHISYHERFNDSTFTLMISYNSQLPDRNLNLCKVLSLMNNAVFVYYQECENPIINDSISKKYQSPFYFPDATHWLILVKRRKNGVAYFRIDQFLDYNENIENPFPEYSPDY